MPNPALQDWVYRGHHVGLRTVADRAIREANLGINPVADGALIRWLLNRNLSVSVYDGGEWTVTRSTNQLEILAALASTGIDELVVADAAGTRLGWFQLIWSNDPDGSELIADCSANDLCEEACDATADAY